MTDRATGEGDPFHLWLEASRSAFAAAPMNEPLRERCESAFGAWSRFAETYAEAARQGAEAAGPGAADPGAASPGAASRGAASPGAGATGGPFDPFAWTDAASAGGFGDLWRWFGDQRGGWQAEREALTGSREWAAYVLALGRYQAVMAEAWLNAFRRFSEALAAEREDGGKADGGKTGGKKAASAKRDAAARDAPDSWETIRARWQEAADLELARAMRSDAFLAAQRDLARARLDCAALIRSRFERLAEAFGLPTRSEVDTLAERVQTLSREVRALKAAGADGRTTGKPGKAAAKGETKGKGKGKDTAKDATKPAGRRAAGRAGTGKAGR